MIALGQGCASLRPQVEEEDFHPINDALLEQTAESSRAPFSLLSNNKDNRELRRFRFLLSVWRVNHDSLANVLHAQPQRQWMTCRDTIKAAAEQMFRAIA